MPAGASVTAMGPRILKGIAEQVHLLEVERRGRSARTVDPVCQMVLSPEADTVDVTRQGTVIRFCSRACAEQFRSNPARYR